MGKKLLNQFMVILNQIITIFELKIKIITMELNKINCKHELTHCSFLRIDENFNTIHERAPITYCKKCNKMFS